MGKIKISPKRPNAWRQPTKRIASSFALNKATKTLSNVAAVDAATQRGNIKVVVRVRPPNNRETTLNSRVVVHAVDAHMVLFDPPDDQPEFYYKGVRQNYQQGKRNKNMKFAFDNVYGPDSVNEQIFTDVINPVLDTLLNGYNCSVFAYGATGSGKTYTMLGSKDNPGLTFLTVMELYKRLDEMEKEYESEVAVSYLEVYNETIRDLLDTQSGDLQVREDGNGVMVANLTSHKPKDSTELLELLAQGNSVRSQHPTDHNAESSRSHAVFQVYIKLRSRFTELTNKYKSAKLVMVDLAGSEKGAATGCQGQRFREGASINKSLLSLGNCINALADGKKHIPYRDSKLTRILKDSLGGNCKTVMIANVSPSSLSFEDSYNTLRYADRAKRIKFQAKKNTMSVSACLTQYTKVVEEMRHTIEQLEKELHEYKSRCHCNTAKVDVGTETDSELNYEPPPMDSGQSIVPSTSIASERATTSAVPMPCLEEDDSDVDFDEAEGVDDSPKNEDANSSGDTLSNTKLDVPLTVISELETLSQRRQEILKTLCDATDAKASAELKISIKERRIGTIKKLKSSADVKSTSKLVKQVDQLRQWRSAAIAKRRQASIAVKKLDQEIQSYHSQYASALNESVPMKLSDAFLLRNLERETERLGGLKRKYKNLATISIDEWQRSESLLGDVIDFSSSQYLMSKHYKYSTNKMDTNYEKLVSNLCGTGVQWSKDVESKDSKVLPVRTLLNDSILGAGNFDVEEEMEVTNSPISGNHAPVRSHPQKFFSSIRQRPGTPPRKGGLGLGLPSPVNSYTPPGSKIVMEELVEPPTFRSVLLGSAKENVFGGSQIGNTNFNKTTGMNRVLNSTVTLSASPKRKYPSPDPSLRPGGPKRPMYHLNETITLDSGE